MRSSLRISFAASAAGCINPHGPTRFGPGRSCIQPRILRSTSIAYANVVITTSSRIADLIRTTSHTGIALSVSDRLHCSLHYALTTAADLRVRIRPRRARCRMQRLQPNVVLRRTAAAEDRLCRRRRARARPSAKRSSPNENGAAAAAFATTARSTSSCDGSSRSNCCARPTSISRSESVPSGGFERRVDRQAGRRRDSVVVPRLFERTLRRQHERRQLRRFGHKQFADDQERRAPSSASRAAPSGRMRAGFAPKIESIFELSVARVFEHRERSRPASHEV